MSTLVDTELLTDIKRYGAADVSACFSCGTCTAIVPARQRRRDLPSPHHPLRPGGHARRAARKQGAVDLLRLWRVLRDMSDPRRAERVHGCCAALRHRPLRPHRARSHDVHATDHRDSHRRGPGGLLRALHVGGTRRAEHRVAGHLRVHPRGAHPRPRGGGHDPRLPRPAWPASPGWRGPSVGPST